MMDVSFYDFDFNRLGDFTRYTSFNIEPQYCGYGTAELRFPINNMDLISLLVKNEYIFFVAGDYSAIVTGFKITEDIAIYGRTCEWLLTKRGVDIFTYDDKTPEEIVTSIVADSAGDFVTVSKAETNGDKMSFAIDKVKNLHDVVCEILNMQNIGFKLVPDIRQKQFIFSVYSGTECLVLLSQANRTAYDMAYTIEKQDMVTMSGWYERKLDDLGEWNASTNTPRITNNSSENAYTYYKVSADGSQFGLSFTKGDYIYSDQADGKLKKAVDKPENIWVYIENPTVLGAKKWDAVLSGAKTESEAFAEIKTLSVREEIASEVKDVEYGRDYNLGDIVRVQYEAGHFKKSEKMRVSSVAIYFDIDKAGQVPSLSKLEG